MARPPRPSSLLWGLFLALGVAALVRRLGTSLLDPDSPMGDPVAVSVDDASAFIAALAQPCA
jgi:hypothetical protein